jgi:muramoyltetrapeptide carboxypeptidase
MRPYSALAPRARVALVAPAGPLKLPIDLDRAIENAEKLGWEPVLGAHAKSRHTYFAGTDAERLADFNAALSDDTIDGIWCLRGGYGAMRLLQNLDYDALRSRPKPIIGYSDISALHCAIGAQSSLASIHGPTARGTADPCGIAADARTLVSGRARGRLVGGNLALLCALHGTPFQPNYDGAILVLEDVNEAPYRIERMLLQLRLSGDLQSCAGIAFGQFTNTGEKDDTLGGTRSLPEILEEAAKAVGVPTISGIPLGHVADQWSIPLGLQADLDADAKRLSVTY